MDDRGGWEELPTMCMALKLVVDSGEGEMISGENTESVSDSVPERGPVATLGFYK